jgi:hypothetical protein
MYLQYEIEAEVSRYFEVTICAFCVGVAQNWNLWWYSALTLTASSDCLVFVAKAC